MMGESVVGVIAAMPEEIAPLLGRVERYRRERLGGCHLYRFRLGGTEIALLESGMGPCRAEAAARLLVSHVSPRLLLSYGFAGGVRPGLKAGELVLARRVLFLQQGVLSEACAPDRELYLRLWQACVAGGIAVAPATFVTASQITDKQVVAGLLAREEAHPILEMETAAILAVATEAGIPLAALRGISDAAHEELGFSLEEFTDGELNLRLWRVLATVARRPRIIPQLLRLHRNSRQAGSNLAACLETVAGALGGP